MKFISTTKRNAKKSNFGSRSRFQNGLNLTIVGFDFVEDEEDTSATKKAHPVLKTMLNGQPFDNIFLSTLCRSVIDADGNELIPNGTLNQLARRYMLDESVTTDEAWLQRLVQDCAGHNIVCIRTRKYTRMFSNGNLAPSLLLEFNIQ